MTPGWWNGDPTPDEPSAWKLVTSQINLFSTQGVLLGFYISVWSNQSHHTQERTNCAIPLMEMKLNRWIFIRSWHWWDISTICHSCTVCLHSSWDLTLTLAAGAYSVQHLSVEIGGKVCGWLWICGQYSWNPCHFSLTKTSLQDPKQSPGGSPCLLLQFHCTTHTNPSE